MWLAGHTLLLVFLGAFCLFGQGNGALNQAQKNRLLELHNLRRRQVQPQAANMKELVSFLFSKNQERKQSEEKNVEEPFLAQSLRRTGSDQNDHGEMA